MSRKFGPLEKIALKATKFAGSSWAFSTAVLVIIVWALTGPIFGFSDTWQLVINTSTTIVTFLMVFLIQRSQNKESMAIQMKLNELVAALQGASNRLINSEDLSEAEVTRLRHHYQRLAHLAREDSSSTCSHSVEEAFERHKAKKEGRVRLASEAGK